MLFLFNLQALLLQQLKMCASALVVGVSAMVLVRVIGDVASALVSLSAIVLVGAGVVALALVLALGGARGGLADDGCARIVDPKNQWQASMRRLCPLDRLDTGFTPSLSVRQVRGWRGFPRWNLAGLYHTLKQAPLTNRG